MAVTVVAATAAIVAATPAHASAVREPVAGEAFIEGGKATFRAAPGVANKIWITKTFLDGMAAVMFRDYKGGMVTAGAGCMQVIVPPSYAICPSADGQAWVYAGDGDDTIGNWSFGDAFLYGESGNDVIIAHGQPGNLTWVSGGGGADNLYSGKGDEYFVGGPGVDYLHYDGPDYPLSHDGRNMPVVASLADGIGGESGIGETDHFIEMEGLFGGTAADHLTGSATADYLNGGAGADVLIGLGGADGINAGAGDDMIDAGDGNDWVFGNEGYDVIVGGNGDDNLFGNDSSNYLNGGNGYDYCVDGIRYLCEAGY